MSQADELRKAEEDLIKEGLRSYPYTLLALRKFQSNIQNRSRIILKDKLKDLSSAMGVELKEENIISYTCPNLIPEDYNGNWAWVAVRIIIPVPYFDCYFGLRFDQTISQATVTMVPKDRKTADILFARGNTKSPKSFMKERNEVSVDKTVGFDNPESFETTLTEVIDIWIDFWQNIGGINNLLK